MKHYKGFVKFSDVMENGFAKRIYKPTLEGERRSPTRTKNKSIIKLVNEGLPALKDGASSARLVGLPFRFILTLHVFHQHVQRYLPG